MREFLRGVAVLGRGFGYWPRRPGLMALGLIPAAIVGLVLFAGVVALAGSLPALTDAVTPFADTWPQVWAVVLRVAVGAALLGGGIVLAVVSFTALTLIVGDPFYERIWRAVEAELGGPVPAGDTGFWRAVRDGLGLFVRGVLLAVVAAAVGFVPVVGGAIGAVTAVAFTGWLLADELASRALVARGIDAPERRALRRGRRGYVLGFGVATQLCFMVPLGAIVAMPAAVAGATVLARDLLPRQHGAARTPPGYDGVDTRE